MDSREIPKDNLLLAALSPASRKLLLLRSTTVDLPQKTVLYSAEQTPRYAYFLTSGMASVVLALRSGETTEVLVAGRESVIGALHMLGPAPVQTDCLMQLPGTGLRVPFGDLKRGFEESEEVRTRILEMIQEQSISLSQLTGCNRMHEAERRLARWLLMAQDRAETDLLAFTQEFLGNMLGTQRTTVTVIAGELQQRGLIQYSRGKLRIMDRERLEAAACDCYRVLKELYQNLYKREIELAR